VPRIVHGVWRVEVRRRRIPAPPSAHPSYPNLPMEKVYAREPRTHLPQVFMREVGDRGGPRGVIFRGKSTGRSGKSRPSITQTLAQCGRVGDGRAIARATVIGPGVIDVDRWRQKNSLTVHLVNLTNPMMMKGRFAS